MHEGFEMRKKEKERNLEKKRDVVRNWNEKDRKEDNEKKRRDVKTWNEKERRGKTFGKEERSLSFF